VAETAKKKRRQQEGSSDMEPKRRDEQSLVRQKMSDSKAVQLTKHHNRELELLSKEIDEQYAEVKDQHDPRRNANKSTLSPN